MKSTSQYQYISNWHDCFVGYIGSFARILSSDSRLYVYGGQSPIVKVNGEGVLLIRNKKLFTEN